MTILIAGAGHGGLAAAGLLAQKGHSVTVCERCPEHNLGHDWTDIFNMDCLGGAGIPLPPEGAYRAAPDFTVHNPAWTTSVTAAVPEHLPEMCMERRELLRHLIGHARECGVSFEFETAVTKPLIEGDRVTGLAVKDKTGPREIIADLVIDAAGMDSPVRRALPAAWGLTGDFRRDQYFTVWRAFFRRSDEAPLLEGTFNVYFYPMGRRAMAWAAREEDYVDMLCGSFEDTTRDYAEQVRQFLLPRHPEFGEGILRGGQAAKIPVRRPVSVMVANGYAAVGDSAAMTVPIIGSGISNAVRAGVLLAGAVRNIKTCDAASLWPYQVEYMRRIGAVHAALDPLKTMVLTMGPGTVDFLLERRILDAGDMSKARTGQEVAFTAREMAQRGLRGAGRLPTMLGLSARLAASQKLKRHAMAIPVRYDEDAVRAWAKVYDAL
ncbi:MAG: FAD-dependent monooxygenase [Oscillospiraceae bacterium]|nr:FAD-dependent monooxygenase [Oscillospiraceae bacterium]